MKLFSGLESWMRISAASIPPAAKKQNAVTMYRIPIALCPVSVSQLIRPFAGAHVFSMRARSREKSGGAAITAVIQRSSKFEVRIENEESISGYFLILHSNFEVRTSSQGIQIRQQILQLSRAQLIRRHLCSRLDGRISGDAPAR